MAYRPRHQPQLGRGTPCAGRTQGASDCGCRAAQHVMDAQTKGRLKPHPPEFRKRSANQGCNTNTMWDLQKGIQSYKGGSKYKPMKFYIKRSVSDVKAAIRNGKYTVLAIDYGKFNQLMKRTGDPNFSGGHAVAVIDQKVRESDGEVLWLLYDSLDDQRRNNIPQGPRWVARWKLVKALTALGTGGNSNAIFAGVVGGGKKK